jgi:hypothetical protein
MPKRLHVWLFAIAIICLVAAGVVWYRLPKTSNGFTVGKAENQVDSFFFGEGDKKQRVITTKAYVVKLPRGGWYDTGLWAAPNQTIFTTSYGQPVDVSIAGLTRTTNRNEEPLFNNFRTHIFTSNKSIDSALKPVVTSVITQEKIYLRNGNADLVTVRLDIGDLPDILK